MPVHIDELVADVEPEPEDGGGGHEGGAGGGEKDKAWFCAELQRKRMALERRERLRVD